MDQEEEEVGTNVMQMKLLGELAYLLREGNDNKPFCDVASRRIGTALKLFDIQLGSKPTYPYKAVLCVL